MFDMIQWIDNMLCVQGGWLYGDGGIMSESCYKKLAQRRNINIHQRACRNRPAWVVYESMPGMGTGVSVIIPAEGGEES